MSVLISGIRLPFDEPEEEAVAQAQKLCGVQAQKAVIYRRSIDARHGRVFKIFTVCLTGDGLTAQTVEQLRLPQVRWKEEMVAEPVFGAKKLPHRPVVIGAGPAGLFAAYLLAQYGYRPLLLERGGPIEERDIAIKRFYDGGALDPDCNIQFGEGGAGAYSDGKLVTRIHSPLCDTALRILVENDAPEEILSLARPHIGTDLLKNVVQSMRRKIVQQGGEVHFYAAVTDLCTTAGKLRALRVGAEEIPCERAIFAPGHSARDTFQSLYAGGVPVEPKPFSVGVRVEHLQSDIDRMLYGKHAGHPALPPAEYTLSHRKNGRACYSFCMCPGGLVVAAQSEPNSIVTNGMSYHARDGRNANAALAVSVDPADFLQGSPLDGIAFQRRIERAAFAATGNYKAPCQRVGDFLEDRPSRGAGQILPTYPCAVQFGKVDCCLPPFVVSMLRESLPVFGRKMRGFDSADALLTAPETRTSSPVRLPRDKATLESTGVTGLMPCGEGAGYAGGIMSAAVDGMHAAWRLMESYAPLDA